MCLYPRLMENRKYRANKKNGGIIPPIIDNRTRYVPVGCQTCIECRKQKAREWSVRLQEDIKTNKNGIFVTLTFSTEGLKKVYEGDEKLQVLEGYDLDNGIATRAMRLFLERWRKKFKKSLRHWMVTELGHGTTEHMHMHGIIWTDKPDQIAEIWGYGNIWRGNTKNGKLENYVNGKTIGYITKYITKMDMEHLNYKPIILTSPGIGNNYTNTGNAKRNKYNEKTNETYRTESGAKVALPIYWRNKIYTDEEREKLWIEKIDKGIRWVCGEKIKAQDDETYYNVLEYYRIKTHKLGYPKPEFIWSKKAYEEQRRKLLHEKRLKTSGWTK